MTGFKKSLENVTFCKISAQLTADGHYSLFSSMMNSEFSNVQTVYILQSGEQLVTREEFEQVKNRFEWVDKKVLLTEMLHVRTMTSPGCRSIIAVYEEGKTIKTFLNLSADFHPSDLQVQRAS